MMGLHTGPDWIQVETAGTQWLVAIINDLANKVEDQSSIYSWGAND